MWVPGVQDVMKRTRSAEDHARWARCLSEVVKGAAPLCPAAARAACQEALTQLQVTRLFVCLISLPFLLV